MLAGVPNATAYFNIAFFVVLVSMLVQGSTLTTAARRLGVALKQTTHGGQPGGDRHPRPDRAGDRRLPGDRRQRHPRPQPPAGLGAGGDGGAQGARSSTRRRPGRSRPGDYCYFLVGRDRVPRLDTLFRESPDVARRLGLLFGELPIRGETRVAEVEAVLRPRVRPARARDHARRMGRRRASAAGRRSTPRLRFPRASWWSAASSRAGSPASACSSTSCCRSSPTRSSSSGSRPRPTSSAACAAGWRA